MSDDAKSKLVLTPGGYRSKELVQAVAVGEAVRQNPDGTFTVVPSESINLIERTSEMPDIVLTPGGYRPRSKVHFIGPNHTIRHVLGGHHQELDPAGVVVKDLTPLENRPAGLPVMPRNVARVARKFPAFASGWISYADWTNTTGSPVSLFSTKWTVPPEPSTSSGQTIFLFNGIQNSSMIYQPVLQWGPSAAGGGDYWAVASWYADGQGGQANYSTLVKVQPGQDLIGVMALAGHSPGGFSYKCEFVGIPNTSLVITDVQELTWCIETLEAYGITKSTDYPATSMTSFREISLQIGNAPPTNPPLSWTPVDAVTDNGQHVLINSNSNPGGEVDIHYGGA